MKHAALAARDNALWCDAVCRAQGLLGRLERDAWTSRVRTPEFYPDAVTLVADVEPTALLARIDDGPGASIKDSFRSLDLAPYGYAVLFEASWIAREPSAPPVPALRWQVVTDAAGLAAFARAWSGDPVDHGTGDASPFRPGLLADPSIALLAGSIGDGAVVAGAVLTLGDGTVGISNLFAAHGYEDEAWAGALYGAAERRPGTVQVGYETGVELEHALRNGFRVTGELRVWFKN
jgi:hypothetical protein